MLEKLEGKFKEAINLGHTEKGQTTASSESLMHVLDLNRLVTFCVVLFPDGWIAALSQNFFLTPNFLCYNLSKECIFSL